LDALRRLDVWKRACRFSVDVYKGTVARSALSIASNIAEGYERETARERVRFLMIAKGSCGECWTQLLIGIEAGLLPPELGHTLANEADDLAKMLRGLAKHFEDRGS